MATDSEAINAGYARVNGLETYYEICGDGPPIVLLHGGFGAVEMERDVISALARWRTVIAADLQAHGRTPDVDRALTPEAMADDIAALCTHLRIEPSDVMGYSLGAEVALQMAIRHSAAVARLIVVSTPFRRSGWYSESLVAMDRMGPEAAEFLKKTPLFEVYSRVAPNPDHWSVLVSKMGDLLRRDYDWSEAVAAITSPTLLVFGDADDISPDHAAQFFRLLGGGQRGGGWDGSGVGESQLAILPGVTHYNIFTPEMVERVVAPFLAESRPHGGKS